MKSGAPPLMIGAAVIIVVTFIKTMAAGVPAEPNMKIHKAGVSDPENAATQHARVLKTRAAPLGLPPRTRLVDRQTTVGGKIAESVTKLESHLSPEELQVFYTDLLVADWLTVRDNLTAGVGWNGVFMQIEGKERSLGIFAVVKSIGRPSGPLNPTRISIIKVEQL